MCRNNESTFQTRHKHFVSKFPNTLLKSFLRKPTKIHDNFCHSYFYFQNLIKNNMSHGIEKVAT